MQKSTITPDRILDCSGLTCPQPVIELSAAIKEIELGQVLKLISTDPGSQSDMEAWAEQTGNSLIDFSEDDGSYIFYFLRLK